MSGSTANGVTVLEQRITMPRVGRWTAEITLSGEVETKLAGDVKIQSQGETFVGRLARPARAFANRTEALIAGGKGGLPTELPRKFYSGCAASLPIGDILREIGETLSDTADSALLKKHLNRWSRVAGPAHSALTTLTDKIGASWRVLADGTIWIGTETWPAVEASTFGSLMTEDQLEQSAIYATTRASLRPGMVVGGRRVSVVEYTLDRTEVWFEAEGSPFARARGALEALVQKLLRPTLYFGKYSGEVVKEADGKLDVKLDDQRIPSPSSVVVRHGIPGTSLEDVVGRRCNVGFENGDPSAPYVADWAEGGTAKLGTMLLIQTSGLAIFQPLWFPAGTVGDIAALAAQDAAILAGHSAFLLPITAGKIAL